MKKPIRRKPLPAIINATTAYLVVAERWRRLQQLEATIPLLRQAIRQTRPIAPQTAAYLAGALKSLLGARNHADGKYRGAHAQAETILGRRLTNPSGDSYERNTR